MKAPIIASCLALLLSTHVTSSNQDATTSFQLSWIRQYGRAVFQECRVDVFAFEGSVGAQLHCIHIPSPGRTIPPLTAKEKLSPAEAKQLMALVQRSNLYDGGHVGTDRMAADGSFEVLKLGTAGGTVMLVTSGNPTFQADGPRRTLLETITRLEKRLADKAKSRDRF